ncbi:MAG: AtpZ/AtpI family protein [Acidimicrobiales bacterium]
MNGPRSHEPHDGPDQDKSTLRDLPGVAAFGAMGITLAACEALGVLLGLYLDRLWHLAPWGLLMGIVLGSVTAVTSVVKLVRRYL